MSVRHTIQINRLGQLDMTEMSGALSHALRARLALEVAVDGTHAGIVQTADLGPLGALVNQLCVLDLGHRHVFLCTFFFYVFFLCTNTDQGYMFISFMLPLISHMQQKQKQYDVCSLSSIQDIHT